MKLFTHWRRPPKHPEEMDPLTKTESAGYIPPKKQIENLIEAGRRLQEYRKEMYDFPEGEDVDESYEDPTRGPGYDLADFSRDKQGLVEKVRAQDRASKTKGSNDTAVTPKVDPKQSSEVSTK